MKLLTSLALISLAVTVPARADTYSCPNPAVQWIAGPAHGFSDQFASTCTEPAHPSPGLVAAYDNAGAGPIYSDFDSTVFDQHFLHTMKGFPNGIVGATLLIRARPLNVSLNGNDTISLRFLHPVTGLPQTNDLWSRYFGGSKGLVTNEWNTANYPNGQLFSLDLCDLPLDTTSTNPNVVSDLIPYLDLYKHLDIVVQDDTAIDFVSLKLTHCCGGSISIFALHPCLTIGPAPVQPALWCAGCATPGGVIDVGVQQGIPFGLAALFLGVGEGSVPVGFGATLDILPLVAGPIMLPLDQEGEIELSALLPANTATGVSINLQAIVIDTNTGELGSTNGVKLSIQ